MREEIIAAISTAQGQGGIGAIRVSGFGSIDLVDRIFHSRPAGNTAYFGCDGGRRFHQ